MHVAASAGHADTISFLISNGAKVNARDRWGGSPRDDAVRHGHVQVSEILINFGAETPSTQFEIELINASFSGNLDTVKKLLDGKVTPNCKDYDLRTPLHLAAAHKHLDIVKLLLENGADADAEDRFGGTPLSDALRNKKRLGNDEIVDLLLKYSKVKSLAHLDVNFKIDGFVATIASFQIIMLLLHGFLSRYADFDAADTAKYPMYQDVHVFLT